MPENNMDNKYVISLEIGSSRLQLAAASFSPDTPGHITVIGMEEEPLSNSVRFGRIQNVEDVARQSLLALDRMRALPALADKKISGVYAAIGGRSLHSVTAKATLTFPEETEITDKTIQRLHDDALATMTDKTDVLAVIPTEYSIDSINTPKPVGVFGTRIDAEFTMVVCNSLNARNLERVVIDRLGMDICAFIVRPLAIASLCLTEEETKPGCMLVDFGAETTTVSIYRGGALRYLATIPLGSQNITHDISAGLGIVESQAENVKIRLGNAMPDPASALSPEQRQIDNYVHARALEIVANIMAQINYAGLKPMDLRAGIIVTGGGTKLKNFCRLLEIQSSLNVSVAALPASVRMATATINGSDMLGAIAVAAQGAQQSLNPQASPCVETVPTPATTETTVETTDTATDAGKAADTPTEKKGAAISIDGDTTEYNYPESPFGYYDYPHQTSRRGNSQTDTYGQTEEDDTLLLDDDEAERLRERRKAENERRKAKAREAAEKKARRDAMAETDWGGPDGETPQRQNNRSILNRLTVKISEIIKNVDGSSDGGRDLDDD